MSSCPVVGCPGNVRGDAFKSLAKSAAQLQLFINMLNRLADIWDLKKVQVEFGDTGWSAEEARKMATEGAQIMHYLHAGAHRVVTDTGGRIPETPSVEVWRGWENAATPWCIALSVVDRDWCLSYWAGLEWLGVVVPLKLRRGLSRAAAAAGGNPRELKAIAANV
jgi:hypothetical protein